MNYYAAPNPSGPGWAVISNDELLAGFYGSDAQTDAEAFAALKKALDDPEHVLRLPSGCTIFFKDWSPP
jgi:hypothetical protein